MSEGVAAVWAERVPSLAPRVGDSGVAVEQAVREEPLAEVEPGMHHRMEFGYVGRPRDQDDVGGYAESA
jgi:hypothetical protein